MLIENGIQIGIPIWYSNTLAIDSFHVDDCIPNLIPKIPILIIFLSEDIFIIWKQAKIVINADWLTDKSIVTEFIFSPTIINVFYACNEEFHALVDIGFNNKTVNTFFYCQALWCVLMEM